MAKALALGAGAVAVGAPALIAPATSTPGTPTSTAATTATTRSAQGEELAARPAPVEAGHRLANHLRVLTTDAQPPARARGKAHLPPPEPEDLVAPTIESAAMARAPLAGTNWIPGEGL
jgi:type IV secretory pathway VirB10-like protein